MQSNEKKHQIQNDYDQTAQNYDTRYEQGQDQKLRLLFQRLKSPQGLILDDGAGTGLLWTYLIKTNNAAQIQSKNMNPQEFSIEPPLNPSLQHIEELQKPIPEETNITWGDLANFIKAGGQLEIGNNDIDEEETDDNTELAAFIGKGGPIKKQSLTGTSETESQIPDQLPSYPSWNIIALDISGGMLDVLHKKVHQYLMIPPFPNERTETKIMRRYARAIQPICGDAENLPFRPGIFDMIFAITAIQNLPNPEIGLQEIARVKQAKTKIGITYLKKSISKENLLHLFKRDLGYAIIIAQVLDGKELSLEDWICYIA